MINQNQKLNYVLLNRKILGRGLNDNRPILIFH